MRVLGRPQDTFTFGVIPSPSHTVPHGIGGPALDSIVGGMVPNHQQQQSEMMIDLDMSDSVSALSPTSFSQDDDEVVTAFACENIYLLRPSTTRTPAIAKMSLQRRTLQSMRAESMQRRRTIIRRAAVVSSITMMVLIPVLLHSFSSAPSRIKPSESDHLIRQHIVASKNESSTLGESGTSKTMCTPQHAPNATPNRSTGPPFSIVVQLSGEMGNHLSKLASGMGVALWLHQLYPDRSTQLRFRHQERTTKWIAAVDNLHACVPHLADLNASQAQEEAFPRTLSTVGINSNDPDEIEADLIRHARGNDTTTFYSDHLSVLDPYMDRYYSVFRNYFAWNTTNDSQCCKDRPYADETVIHIRHFLVEMPRKGLAKGYEELSPHDLLTQALASLPPPRRIALVSRYPDRLEDYVTVLSQAGYSVRVIQHQTTAQDFCFLLRSQQTMIGTIRSTFFWWAAVLSNATSVVAYSIDSPAKRAWAQAHNTTTIESFPFTHPDMVRKFQFPLYTATNATATGRGAGTNNGP